MNEERQNRSSFVALLEESIFLSCPPDCPCQRFFLLVLFQIMQVKYVGMEETAFCIGRMSFILL